MAYEITATRKRPHTFDEIVGQEFVVATLKNAVKQEKIAHAYLFSGPRGVGKTSAARVLAKALNCEEGPTEYPCNTCGYCTEITQGNSLDVIEIDGASNTSVNDVREIKDEVLFAPNSCRYKVYIIDEVHMLSTSAFNALLKTIEEPPPYIVFIFATTEVHKVPATIRSRCQQFNFRLIGLEHIKNSLSKVVQEMGLEAEDQALLWLAKEATGSLRDAYTLLDQVASFSEGRITLNRIKEKLGIVGLSELNEIVAALSAGEAQAVLSRIDEVIAGGVAIDQFVINITEYFRNILFLSNGITSESILGYPADSFLTGIAESYSPAQIEKAIELLLELYRNLRYSLNPRFELELTVSRLARLKSLISNDDLLSKISEMKSRMGEEEEEPAAEAGGEGAAESDLHERVLDSIRKSKPTLASALMKAANRTWEDGVYKVQFLAKDRFSGGLIEKESAALADIISKLQESPAKLRVEYRKEEPKEHPEDQFFDRKVDLVRKVFKGDEIRGEQK
jgi:DNA polymerase-3 subunit gamma/tau